MTFQPGFRHYRLPPPAYPEIRSAAYTIYTGSSGTAVSLTMPTGIVAGDLLILTLYGIPSSTPSGWTSLGTVVSTPEQMVQGSAYYRVATGSDATTVNYPSVWAWQAHCVAIKAGTYSGAPQFASASGEFTAVSPPSKTHTGGTGKYLWLASYTGFLPEGDSIGGAPTGYTTIGSSPYNSFFPAFNTFQFIGTSSKTTESATEDPPNNMMGSFGGSYWVAFTIGIKGS